MSCAVTRRYIQNAQVNFFDFVEAISPFIQDSMYQQNREPFCTSGGTPGVGSGYDHFEVLGVGSESA